MKKCVRYLVGLALLGASAMTNASLITWTVIGEVGELAATTTSDDELLVGATLEFSITVDTTNVYADWLGIGFIATAHIIPGSGSLTISESGIPANNATFPILSPHPLWPTEPYGFVPTFANVNAVFFPAFVLPSGNILDLAHNFPVTTSGALATIGGSISIADFPVGSGFQAFNPTIFTSNFSEAIGQYQSTIPTASVIEGPIGGVPEPATLLLLGMGLAGLGFARRRRVNA